MARRQRSTNKGPARAASAARVWIARAWARLSVAGFDAWAKTIRSAMLNLAFLVFLVVLVPLLVSQFSRDQVIIEPIAVPGVLAERGLTANVVANRLWDGLSDVKRAANTSKDMIASLPDTRRVEFSFPDSGLSIESFVYHARKLFNTYETRIAGEFVCGDADCTGAGLQLRLRIVRDSVEIIDLPAIGVTPERQYFAEAAAAVLGVLDPFVALAATSETRPLQATTLARRLIRLHHKDAKWAHNLIGLIRSGEGDGAAALEEYRSALALDPDFLPARVNLGNALLASGDHGGARQAYQMVRDLDPQNVFAAQGFAELSLASGDAALAVKHYLDAAEWNPVDPRYLTLAGRIEIAQGREAEGVTLLRRALELDPGYLPAFAELAAKHLVKGDHAAAERIYRDAADYAPDDAEAQAAHGRILAILQDWQAAERRYARAALLSPETADFRREHAVMLQRLGRHDDALTELTEVARKAPDAAAVHLSMADSYRDTGRNAEAVAAYQRFLDLDKTDSPMRPIAERFIEILSQ